MGLDAVVYLRKNNLKIDGEKDIFQTDERTGEVYVDDLLSSSYSPETFVAVSKHLGNIATIGYIRRKTIEVTDDKNSILLKQVLFNVSHSGDLIEIKNLESLELEINRIEEKIAGNSDEIVAVFLEAMKELVQVAKIQGNPIVFV